MSKKAKSVETTPAADFIGPVMAIESVIQPITDAEVAAIMAGVEEAAGAVTFTPEELMILDGASQIEDAADAPVGPMADGLAFADLLATVTETQRVEQAQSLVAAFEDRAQYENHKNPDNDNIQKTISKLIARLSTPGVVAAQVVVGKGAGFVNVSENSNARRNVYALDKLADLLYGAVTGHVKNFVNRAVLGSMVRLEGKLAFTGLAAKACASDKVGIDAAYKGLMVRHDMSESTASTQASSTMTALEDLGVVTNSGTRAHPVYAFTETPLAMRLKEIGLAITAARA